MYTYMVVCMYMYMFMHVCMYKHDTVSYEEIAGTTALFNMASNYVRIPCGAQLYCYLQHFALVQQIITQLHAKRSCLASAIRNAR